MRPDGTVEILAPLTASALRLEEAWRYFEPWLERRRQMLARRPPEELPHPFEFRVGGRFFYLGAELELAHREHAYGSTLIRCGEGKLWTASTDPAVIARMLEAFYRRQARRLIAGKLEIYTRQFGIATGALSINGARRRFGSCNSRGDLNFSWRLAMYPERLMELVILHELAHRSEMNHSAAFYRVLAGYLPDHRDRDRELKSWSRRLSGYPA